MNWLLPLLNNLNYWTVFLLMFIEGSVIPAPSELIVPPAAYRAAAGELNIFLVVLVATLGALAGSTANYFAAYYLGRPMIYRFANSRLGHLCLLNQQKIEQAEKYFYDHGVVATLTGRLLPGIRQIISIPAGLSKMKFWKFALYTTIGAGIWNCVLATLGWYLHSFVPLDQLNSKIEEYNSHIQIIVVAALVLIALIAGLMWYFKRKKKKASISK
ncbi:DedA family protein [Hoylesella saccharolytica]|jgi:dedA family protein|uniref:DedA family protein n=1 Tax=Hoylesella saccharolytica TaxID=633701 RepID=UPI0028E64AAB|nr:DedA family protein [Hoylesella saccharolytica]